MTRIFLASPEYINQSAVYGSSRRADDNPVTPASGQMRRDAHWVMPG
jgi:hypothetical protein